MLKKSLCLLFVIATFLPAASMRAQAFAAATVPAQIVVERGVAMKTRDGVTLRADIYRPAAEGKYPVLLTRTPYYKDNFALALPVAPR